MSVFRVRSEHKREFEREGYVIVPGLLSSEETSLLGRIARADRELTNRVSERRDALGGVTTLSLENDLGDDIYSAIVHSRRVAGSMERLLGGEVYHYHHKMNMKAPLVGGAWEWHQDYGYWYTNGCLSPDMASCMIAVDPATRENGCLQVIPGSHHLGRIDHVAVGDQTGADPERVAEVLKRLPLDYVEMAPGDGLFFHSNLLHKSDQNLSPHPRWVFICCYNRRSNDPYKAGRHPNYTPLEIWDDSCVLAVGHRHWDRLEANHAGNSTGL